MVPPSPYLNLSSIPRAPPPLHWHSGESSRCMWCMWKSEVNFAESVLSAFAWAPGIELRSPAGSALPTAPAFGLVSFVARTSLCQEFMLHSIIGHCPTSSSPDQQAMDWRPHLPQVQVSSCSVSKGLYKMAANCRCSVNVYCEPAAHSK